MTDYHGPKSLDKLCEWAVGRCERNLNANFLVTGEPGVGKSALVLMMAKRIYPAFDPKLHVATSVQDINSIVKMLPPGGVIDVDEAIVAGGNKRRAMEGGNKDNVDRFATDRKRNLVRFDILPHLSEADKVLTHYTSWMLDVRKRGVVTVLEPVRLGFKHLAVNFTERFTEEFPDCAKEYPGLWGAYQERIFSYLNGERDGVAQSLERRAIMRNLIRARLRQDSN